MVSYKSSRVLPVILTIVIIIVAIAGLVALMSLIFKGTGSSSINKGNGEAAVSQSRQNLLDSTAGSSVSMTVRGPIVADEDFRSYRVEVSPSERKFQAFNGYLDTVTASEVLENNVAAYNQFVHALERINMVSGMPFVGEANDVSGVCSSGKLYEFSTLKKGKARDMFWTSTCSESKGSLKGSAAQISTLFLNQIPASSPIAESLKL